MTGNRLTGVTVLLTTSKIQPVQWTGLLKPLSRSEVWQWHFQTGSEIIIVWIPVGTTHTISWVELGRHFGT